MTQLSTERWVALVGFAGVVLGAFLPWVRVVPLASVPGTDGDGLITLGLGVAGIMVIARGHGLAMRLLTYALAAAAFGLGAYHIVDLSSGVPVPHPLQEGTYIEYERTVGSGLWLTAVGGLVAAVCSLVMFRSEDAERLRGQDQAPSRRAGPRRR